MSRIEQCAARLGRIVACRHDAANGAGPGGKGARDRDAYTEATLGAIVAVGFGLGAVSVMTLNAGRSTRSVAHVLHETEIEPRDPRHVRFNALVIAVREFDTEPPSRISVARAFSAATAGWRLCRQRQPSHWLTQCASSRYCSLRRVEHHRTSQAFVRSKEGVP